MQWRVKLSKLPPGHVSDSGGSRNFEMGSGGGRGGGSVSSPSPFIANTARNELYAFYTVIGDLLCVLCNVLLLLITATSFGE